MSLSIVLGVLYGRVQSRIRQEKSHPLLANRLFTANPGDTTINFEPLRQQIRAYLTGLGVPYSFYFEYLFTGSNIRAGDDNQLVGASLMKIPIVMDLYKAVEEGKISLDEQVTVPKEVIHGDDKQYGNQIGLKPGDKISLRQATEVALKESDNTAAYTIFSAIQNLLPPDDQALNNLDIATQTGESDKGNYALISARSYTSVIKCLYFSCFLSLDDSQAVLKDLSISNDNSRIRAGVPSNVNVARKIGSFGTITQSDCGIVYVPDRRYAICIMLDEDATKADQHIKKLSEMTYNYVSQLK